MNDYIATISIGNTNKSLSLEDYQGKLSLVSTWETRDGAVKPNWCFRQDRVEGENVPGKAIPMKLLLGDKAQAVAILTQLINALEPSYGSERAVKTHDKGLFTGRMAAEQDDIPF